MGDSGDAKGVSRRTFLKGAAGSAALTALPQALLAEPAENPGTQGEFYRVVLQVNGAPQQARVTCRATLAEVLREELKLTGTKIGCGSGGR